jgi:hypothetical protein
VKNNVLRELGLLGKAEPSLVYASHAGSGTTDALRS